MKAISLWQPWASAVALGAKLIETRSWDTDYRGPIAIHAAKRLVQSELGFYQTLGRWQGALRPVGWPRPTEPKDKTHGLPFGAIVAVADLVDCLPAASFTANDLDRRWRPKGEPDDRFTWSERDMGDFAAGRFGWIFRDMTPLEQPIPYKGAQGLFWVPDSVFHQEQKQ